MSAIIPREFQRKSYEFVLPEELIAQYPSKVRGQDRLLVLDRMHTLQPQISTFEQLLNFLPEKSLLVLNNSKVLPARLVGKRETGGRFEFLLLTPLPLLLKKAHPLGDGRFEVQAEGLLHMGAKVKVGMQLRFGPTLLAEVLELGTYGKHLFLLTYSGDLEALFQNQGTIPLPPYIRRKAEQSDTERYQTVYADEHKIGSVAAPTAGLHFTKNLQNTLLLAGIEFCSVTLYVGYGTFSPVREEDIRNHKMHQEFIEVPEQTAKAIKQAKAEGRNIIAVGTTSLRCLEGMYAAQKKVTTYTGWTDIFLYPGKTFSVVDGLLTNFHLPGSSLIMLVAAFLGLDYTMAAYKLAIEHRFQFFSFGDAMLIVPTKKREDTCASSLHGSQKTLIT
ncbi:MAG: tRNA preQ1(34) S-adenosylmethionine ribosyltransferase-isomerase QueA [Desulfovibrio sp.]|nr:tRNA preQ1(34) S-adenosylmethionine ribosyltransferase-isomerase QueA [Desulfovibrio sp.]